MKFQGVRKILHSFASLRDRAQFEQTPGFMEAYEAELQDFAVARVRSIALIGIVCFLGMGFVDWIFYPHLTPVFIPYRFTFALVATVAIFLTYTSWGKKRSLEIIFLTALYGDLGVSYMTSQISGWTAVYFVGNILVTTGVTMFVPWRPHISFFYCTSSLAGYILINGLFHPYSLEMLIPVMFFIIVGIQAFFSTIGNEVSRMRQLASRLEIEKAHGELKRQSDLLQQQIEAAKEIQQALLPPRVQTMKGLKIEAIYEPSAHLSGDFFDAIVTGDWVYVYLADVTGHGLPAAQITFLVKEIFKAALTHEAELPELFEVVRRKYVDHQLGYDLGLQLMRVHSKTLQAEYLKSNAPNPVAVGPDGEAEELDIPASPVISASVEIAEDQKPRLAKVSFDKNEKIYLYSDGAYEFIASSGREFGLRRLMKTFAETHDRTWPEALAGRLKAENRDEFFPDDLTVLRIGLG